MTKSSNGIKRLGAVILALALMCAMAVHAGAATTSTSYNVTVYKSGTATMESMAGGAVNGPAEVIYDSGTGLYTVTIPLKPATVRKLGMNFKGYIKEVTVAGAVSSRVTQYPYSAGNAEMEFVMETLPDNMRFRATYDVAIYWPWGAYFCDHSDFPGTPAVISSDIVLTAR